MVPLMMIPLRDGMRGGLKYFQGHPLSFPNIPLHTQQMKKVPSQPLCKLLHEEKRKESKISPSLSHTSVVLWHNKSDDVIRKIWRFFFSGVRESFERLNTDKDDCAVFSLPNDSWWVFWEFNDNNELKISNSQLKYVGNVFFPETRLVMWNFRAIFQRSISGWQRE